MSEDDERCLLLGLNECGGAGLRESRRIIQVVGGLAALDEPKARRRLLEGRWPRALKRALGEESRFMDVGRAIAARAADEGVLTTVHGTPSYPRRLEHLANPPLVVFHQGTLPAHDDRLIAIVGSRRASRYGLRSARRLSRELAHRNLSIVSGLARGVDTEAHMGSLDGVAKGYAVLGSGHFELYPPENRGLADRLCETGAVLSEFSPDCGPRPGHFPRRNRLIAALASVILVIEAGQKSGALITARWAADLGRDVAALPGPIDSPTSVGTHALLKDGALLVRGADDLSEAGWIPEADPAEDSQRKDDETLTSETTAEDRRVLELLDHEAVTIDVLLAAMEVPAGALLGRLLSLETRGLIAQEDGLRFRKLSRTERIP